jgi:hypothetical protein
MMDAETRMERKVAAKDRKYSLRYRPKQVGRSVFTILQVQAKRAEQSGQTKGGRVEKPSRSRVFVERVVPYHRMANLSISAPGRRTASFTTERTLTVL